MSNWPPFPMSTAVSLPNICAPRPLTGTCGTCCWSAAPWTGAGFPRPSSGPCSSRSWISRSGASRGALHHGKEHPQAHRAAVPGRAAGRIRAGQTPEEKTGRVSPAPGRAEVPRSGLRLRQLPGHRLPGTAGRWNWRSCAPCTRTTANWPWTCKAEILCDVDQFYGIEIEEFPAQIAQTALWLMDHQMNLRVSEEFGQYFSRLPLAKVGHHRPRQRPATGLAGDRAAPRN